MMIVVERLWIAGTVFLGSVRFNLFRPTVAEEDGNGDGDGDGDADGKPDADADAYGGAGVEAGTLALTIALAADESQTEERAVGS